MDYIKILKRAWTILWSYRVLWIFGILIALTSGGSSGNGGNANFNFDHRDFGNPSYRGALDMERFFQRVFSDETLGMWVGVAIAAICVLLLLGILGAVVRYVSHTAAIRMVDEYERTGEKVGFRQGWRWGWSRSAWRLFLIDLLISIPIIILVLGMVGCGVLLLGVTGAFGGRDPGIAAILVIFGLVMTILMVAFVVGLVVSLVQPVIRRYAVLENAGVIDSIRGGLGLIRRRFLDVFLMWLILVALAIAYTLVMIPVVLLLIFAALVVGGGLGMAVYFATLQTMSQPAAIFAGILAGLPFFILLVAAPSVFLEGLRQIFGSSAWTLAYRELGQPPDGVGQAEVFTSPTLEPPAVPGEPPLEGSLKAEG